MRACIYARVSTEEQALKGHSLGEQIKHSKLKAIELGAVGDIAEFVDDGYSGDDSERPNMIELTSRVEQGEFDLVVCYDLDRWARDLGDQIMFARSVEKYARLEFVTHSRGDKESPEDTMFFYMKGAFAEYEKAKIRQRTIAGRKAKAQKGMVSCTGGWAGHPGPFGYDYDAERSQFVINEKEAGIVKKIYTMCDNEGMGISKITIALNEERIPSPKGCRWHTSTVGRILHNEAYAGTFNNFKRKTCSKSGKTLSVEIRPQEQWIPVKIPSIISKVQWEGVQRKISQNAAISRRRKHQYLLVGHIYCGECGRRVYTTPKTTNTGAHLYYRCAGRKREVTLTPCEVPMFPANSIGGMRGLDDMVWNFLDSALKNPDLITREVNKAKDNSEAEIIEELLRKLDKKQKQIDDLEKQVDEAWEMRLEGYVEPDELKKRIQKIEQKKKSVIQEISNTKNKLLYIEEKQNFSQNIENYCKLIADKLDSLSFDEKKEIIKLLDVKIHIYANKTVEIEWPFSNELIKVGELSHEGYCWASRYINSRVQRKGTCCNKKFWISVSSQKSYN